MSNTSKEKMNRLLNLLDREGGSLVVSKNDEIWTAAFTTLGEDGMTVAGFDTDKDLDEVLDSVLDELEESIDV